MTRRWILRIILCLILGAITTVAVAWWIASTTAEHRVAYIPIANDLIGHTLLNLQRFHGSCSHRTVVSTHQVAGWQRVDIASESVEALFAELPNALEYHGRTITRTEYEFGWPMCALRMAHDEDFDKGISVWHETLRLNREPAKTSAHVLPVGIIVGGFITDSFLFSLIWLVPVSIPALIEIRRRMMGRCPRCGYDLRGQRLVMSDQWRLPRDAPNADGIARSAPHDALDAAHPCVPVPRRGYDCRRGVGNRVDFWRNRLLCV